MLPSNLMSSTARVGSRRPPKGRGGFKAKLIPLMFYQGLAHCWTHSSSSVKLSHGCLWNRNWNQHMDFHQHHSSLCYLGIFQQLLSSGCSSQTCLGSKREALGGAFVKIYKHFLSPTLGRHKIPPVWWISVRLLNRSIQYGRRSPQCFGSPEKGPRGSWEEMTPDLRI